ncbi:uncharacterized protein LOC128863183 [Anastrepha ludens]|uniref:uncharacterized protein LOC128863183 n=1 Tax=Anastrepha ludens TaxID=28586 RepID=UPI0023B04144|nr:uncharacterized protein LOC128863183 [Anastrepha ludens]
MVEFWGIFVVFSACAAFQLTESRYHNDYSSLDLSISDLSASDQLHDISNILDESSKESNDLPKHVVENSLENSSSDSAQETEPTDLPSVVENSSESTETAVTIPSPTKKPKKRLSLSARRQRLFVFAKAGMNQYEKDYVSLTRKAIKRIVVELEALPAKSEKVKEKLSEIKEALKEIEGVDVAQDSTEFDALGEASEIVSSLHDELDNPLDAPRELEQVLEKVGWMDMRYKLGDEMESLINGFGKEFNIFIASLTPRERLMEAGLVELHRRFAKGDTDTKWNSFTEFWTYFDL